ncbi:Uncharacterised protein [Collinsella aerofaciens]|uniref:Uncharacterized protein n=1 Tax=Collinsella aerofaciens TaxID=74426 RepID=A0A6N3B6D4_9ACTN
MPLSASHALTASTVSCGGCGHDLLAFQDRAVRIARGAYHLGAAGLERSDKLPLYQSVLLLVELFYL